MVALTTSGAERTVQARDENMSAIRQPSIHFSAADLAPSQPSTPFLFSEHPTSPVWRTSTSSSRPSSPITAHFRTKSGPLPAYVAAQKLRGRPQRIALAGLALVLLLYVISHVTRVHSILVSLTELAVVEATDPAPRSCETCVANPADPLCAYGIDNVRLSRMYEGSGFRLRKVVEKALRGERVSIGIIGASVTAGVC